MSNEKLKELLKSASRELSHEDYDKAKGSFNDILDEYPECSQAYLGLLMAELKVNSYSRLENSSLRLSDLKNFKRALEFADSNYKQKLFGIQKRNENKTLIINNDNSLKEENAPAEIKTAETAEITEKESIKETTENIAEDTANGSLAKDAGSQNEGSEPILEESKIVESAESMEVSVEKTEDATNEGVDKEAISQNEGSEPTLEESKIEESAEKVEDSTSEGIVEEGDSNLENADSSIENSNTEEPVDSELKTKSSKSIFMFILLALILISGAGYYFYYPFYTTSEGDSKNNGTNSEAKVERSGSIDFSKPMTFKVNGVTFDMMPCLSGTFLMGSPENELGRDKSEVQHRVTLTKSYFIGKYEVTQKLYEAVMEENPSRYIHEDMPVESMTLAEAKKFCERLNTLTLANRPDSYEFDLPTEAQWEYACRAGSPNSIYNGKEISDATKPCGNLDEVAWYYYNAYGTTQKVGSKKPNAWQIYDMLGNVSEICLDDLRDSYEAKDEVDPCFVDKGVEFVVARGGNVMIKPKNCRSATRSEAAKSEGNVRFGFRIVLTYKAKGK